MTETPSTTNEIVHVVTYVNSKHYFIIFLGKFSKHAVFLYLPYRNSQTLVGKIRKFSAIKSKIQIFVLDNECNSTNVRNFLTFHFTKPNSHTGNSDIVRIAKLRGPTPKQW